MHFLLFIFIVMPLLKVRRMQVSKDILDMVVLSSTVHRCRLANTRPLQDNFRHLIVRCILRMVQMEMRKYYRDKLSIITTKRWNF